MSKPRNNNGFSLIEALFATAVLAFAIVPAVSTTSAHIAATHRLETETAARMHLENLCSDAELQLLLDPSSADGSVTITEHANLVVGKPVSIGCGNYDLVRVHCKALSRSGSTFDAESLALVPRE